MRERRRRWVVLGDVAAAHFAVALAWLVAPANTASGALTALTIATLAWPIVMAVRGLYSLDALSPRGQSGSESGQVVRSLVVFLALLAVGGAIFGRDVSNRSFLVAAGVLLVGSVIVRWVADRHLRSLRRAGRVVDRTLAVGVGPEISGLVDRLAGGTEHPFVVVGACVEGQAGVVEDVPTVAWLGDQTDTEAGDAAAVEAVLAAVAEVRADTVCVVPGSSFSGVRLRALAWALDDRRIKLTVALGTVDVAPHRLHVAPAGAAALIQVGGVVDRPARSVLKTTFDRLAAILGLLVLVPVFLVLAVAVRVSGRGPVFYRQRRVGRSGRSFTMLKFRSMRADADKMRAELEAANEHDGAMFKMRNDPRVTRVGRWLRRTSLDELPQLVNVLRGDMSLVGPRPPLPEEAVDYDDLEQRRLRVTPGMTGLWQVSGRADLTWDETVRLDLQYVDNWTLTGDARLLARTVGAVVRGTGAY